MKMKIQLPKPHYKSTKGAALHLTWCKKETRSTPAIGKKRSKEGVFFMWQEIWSSPCLYFVKTSN